MKLEVGKKYVTRGGDIVAITVIDNSIVYNGRHYPYIGDNLLNYEGNGYFLVDDDGNHHLDIDDLIEEYNED